MSDYKRGDIQVDEKKQLDFLVSSSIGPFIGSSVAAYYYFFLYRQIGDWHFLATTIGIIFFDILFLFVAYISSKIKKRTLALLFYSLSAYSAQLSIILFTKGAGINLSGFFAAIMYGVYSHTMFIKSRERNLAIFVVIFGGISGILLEFFPLVADRPDNPTIITYVLSGITAIITLVLGSVVVPATSQRSIRSMLTQSFILVTLAPLWGVLPILQNSRSGLLFVLFIVVSGTFASLLITRSITIPIETLTETARKIGANDLSARVRLDRHDELGILAQTLNKTTQSLHQTIQGLEKTITDRTRDLRIASEVSRQITRELDLEKLLPQLVEQTKNGFGLYYSSVFLYNEQSEELMLVAGTGKPGDFMKQNAKSFHISARPSLVAECARECKSVVINDTSESSIHYFNSHLPLTCAEAVFPMVVGEELVGVLDLQSEVPNRFQESDIQIFSTLAEQIAIAVRNAQLYRIQEHVAEELSRADKMKSQFLASMSHELRTPLNAIINFTELVYLGSLGEINTQQAEVLNYSLSSSKHLLQLINDVLDVGKIQAGKLSLFVEENVNLYDEISAVLNMADSLLQKKIQLQASDLQLVKEVDPELPFVNCDRRRLRQVLLNLLSNAIKFTDTGIIKLIVKREDDQIAFSVFDTGNGISEELQEYIFEPFVQTIDGVKFAEGTGLGLPIARSLIEAHGGRLWLVSKLGSGSTFHFTLPRSQKIYNS